ncbi:unnamed protein product [Victoria cruziana]
MEVAALGSGGAGSFVCSAASVGCSNRRLLSFRSSLGSGMRFRSHNLSLRCKRSKLRLVVVANAADSTQASSASTLNKTIVPDDGFSLSKVSFGVVGLGVGLMLLGYGFGAYFSFLPGSEWSALLLTYGFPLAIIGMALKYAELKPVLCITYTDAERLRETCATPILKQVKSDVTRFRYGDEQHLDEALKRIFQYGQAGGIPRRSAPVLQAIREEVCLAFLFFITSYHERDAFY